VARLAETSSFRQKFASICIANGFAEFYTLFSKDLFSKYEKHREVYRPHGWRFEFFVPLPFWVEIWPTSSSGRRRRVPLRWPSSVVIHFFFNCRQILITFDYPLHKQWLTLHSELSTYSIGLAGRSDASASPSILLLRSLLVV
jgi:hypothetical protein